MTRLFIFFLILLTTKVYGQPLGFNSIKEYQKPDSLRCIKGTVLEEGRDLPVPTASIIITYGDKYQYRKAVTSNINGAFLVEIDEGNLGKRTKIKIQVVGYEEKNVKLKGMTLPVNNLKIFLTPRASEQYVF